MIVGAQQTTIQQGVNYMSMPATQIRRGNVIVFNGEPCRVVDFHHHTPGNLRAFVQAKLRNLKTGTMFEHRFRAADTVERAFLETHELQYLYNDGLHYHFMNTESFEQVALDEEALGDAAQWLTEGMVIQAEFFEGRPIGVELPNSLEIEVAETEPAAKGDTKTAVMKPARLANGVTVMVPPFINQGDLIRVDPREGKYIERAK
ncbi:MAG: elongation factor P [Gemmatimonadota bacterium]|jgi:elongation factor P